MASSEASSGVFQFLHLTRSECLVNTKHPTMSDSSPITYQLNQTEADYLLLLLSIIESQNWEALVCDIYRNPAAFQWFARNISSVSELNGMTM